jgi:ribosome-associated protein
MKSDSLEGRDFENELTITASRSSGPGGQNVNKVSSKIELRFDVKSSCLLTDDEKILIMNRCSSQITKDGILIIRSQAGRTQYENRIKAISKFYIILRKAFTPYKKRIKTSPTAASKLKRIEGKKIQSKKKALRKSIDE